MTGSTLGVLGLTAFLVALAYAGSSTSDYCNLESCPNQTHTLCKYPGGPINKRCGKVRSAGVTDAEVKDILDAHNRYRSKVANGQETRGKGGPQPAATNLGPLWDQELADIAQAWVNQCYERRDQCRNTAKFPKVGQNIAYDLAWEDQESLKTVSEMVTYWYSDVDYLNSTLVNSFVFSQRIAQYSQMMWAKTTHVGCGVIRSKNPTREWLDMTLVCNYGPAGNERGEAIYQTR